MHVSPRIDVKTGAPDSGQVPHGAIGDVPDRARRAADVRVNFTEQGAASRPGIHIFEDDHARRRDGRPVFLPIQTIMVPIPRRGSCCCANRPVAA
jgi:hypothetical protein